MLMILLGIVIFYVLANFVYYHTLKEAYHQKGFLGVINMSLAILIHQIAGIFFE